MKIYLAGGMRPLPRTHQTDSPHGLATRTHHTDSPHGLTMNMLDIINQVTSHLATQTAEMDALKAQIAGLNDKVNFPNNQTAHLRADISALKSNLDTLGPMWKTREGWTRPIGLLSTDHLRAILDGGFGSSETRLYVDSELRRRASDDAWREKKASGRLRESTEAAQAQAAAERLLERRTKESCTPTGADHKHKAQAQARKEALDKRDRLYTDFEEAVTQLAGNGLNSSKARVHRTQQALQAASTALAKLSD